MEQTEQQKAENEKKFAKFKAELEKHEEAERVKGKIFDPHKLLERASKVHVVDHPVLGQIRYGELTFRDAFEVNKCKSDVEKTETVAWLMMRKAYPDLPRDFLARMPLIESAALIDFLTKQPGFLSAPKISKGGSRTTRRGK